MPTEPRQTSEIRSEVESEIIARTDAISEFTSGSFNSAYVTAHSEQIREAEIKALAATLAGSAEYAGRELTAGDLRDLGVTTVDPDEINPYMDDSQLDRLAANFGIRRDDGSRAQTTVEVSVSGDDIEVQEGTVVTNNLEGDQTQRDFILDVDGDGEITTNPAPTVTPDTGDTTVEVNAIAAEVGSSYNVGTGVIDKVPVPQPGIRSVENVTPATGGESAQSNESLRDEIQSALFETSGGGTESGIIGYIESNVDEDIEVGINEFTDRNPPFVDVVINGGDEAELKQLIAESKPLGIRHNLARPVSVGVGIGADLIVDQGIDDDLIESSIINSLSEFGVGDNFYQTAILQTILDANTNIISGPAINTAYTDITRDQYTYQSGKTVYELTYGPFGEVTNEEHVITEATDVYPLQFTGIDTASVSVSVTEAGSQETLSDSEYSIVDSDGGGTVDALQLSAAQYAPPEATVSLSYTHSEWDLVSVVGDDGTTYEQGTDFTLIDNDADGVVDSIDWSGTASPADNERFFVTYHPNRSFNSDIRVGDTVLFEPDTDRITVESYLN